MPLNPPTVLILASGRGERFKASGGTVHKLQALLAGKPVLQHTLDAVRASGLPWHVEDAGHPGMGDRIAAAVRQTVSAAGWLVLPGDLAPGAARHAAGHGAGVAGERAVVAWPEFVGERGHWYAWARLFARLAGPARGKGRSARGAQVGRAGAGGWRCRCMTKAW